MTEVIRSQVHASEMRFLRIIKVVTVYDKVRTMYIKKCVYAWDVEAVEYFLLPLPAPYKVSRFRVCFRFQLLSSKCFRLHKNFTASSFRFHAPAPYFVKDASASGSSKSQMLPSLLPLLQFDAL